MADVLFVLLFISVIINFVYTYVFISCPTNKDLKEANKALSEQVSKLTVELWYVKNKDKAKPTINAEEFKQKLNTLIKEVQGDDEEDLW